MNETFAIVRELLSQAPSWENWNELVMLLDLWPKQDGGLPWDEVLGYVESHLEQSWPSHIRLPNGAWSAHSCGWRLARAAPAPMLSCLDLEGIWCPSGQFVVDHDVSGFREVTISRPFWFQTAPCSDLHFEALVKESSDEPTLKRLEDSLLSLTRRHDVPECISWFEAVSFCNAMSRLAGLEEAYILDEQQGIPGDAEVAWDWVDVGFDWEPVHLRRPLFRCEVIWKGPACEGFRLPTEAEWAVAAMAATPVFGDWEEFLAGGYWEGARRFSATKEDFRNAWGLSHVREGAWQWCWDVFAPVYAMTHVTDPTGALRVTAPLPRTVRGGGESPMERASRGLGFIPYDHFSWSASLAALRVCRTAMG
jgi:hypothetical protein